MQKFQYLSSLQLYHDCAVKLLKVAVNVSLKQYKSGNSTQEQNCKIAAKNDCSGKCTFKRMTELQLTYDGILCFICEEDTEFLVSNTCLFSSNLFLISSSFFCFSSSRFSISCRFDLSSTSVFSRLSSFLFSSSSDCSSLFSFTFSFCNSNSSSRRRSLSRFRSSSSFSFC